VQDHLGSKWEYSRDFYKKFNTNFSRNFDEFEPIYLDIFNAFFLRKKMHFFLLVNK
jgi:hypothetical protein